jgi:hypothetical protein
MNEEKVEDMKALHNLRMTTTNPEPRLALVLAAPKNERKGVWKTIRAALSVAWNFRARPDLDLEAWREIEFRNEREPERDSRRYLNPWL